MDRNFTPQERQPDCWVNVYADATKPSGIMFGSFPWQTKEDADMAFHNADKVGVYRLRIYLKGSK